MIHWENLRALLIAGLTVGTLYAIWYGIEVFGR